MVNNRKLKAAVWSVFFVLFAFITMLFITKAEALEAFSGEKTTVVDGLTYHYTPETVDGKKCASNVYLENVEIYDDIVIPNELDEYVVISLGKTGVSGQDSFLCGSNSDILMATIDASNCSSLKKINNSFLYQRATCLVKLPVSLQSVDASLFGSTISGGVTCVNPNMIFEGIGNIGQNFHFFMPKYSTAKDVYGDNCIASGKLYGKETYAYDGPSTCKFVFDKGNRSDAVIPDGLFGSYVYGVTEKNVSAEIQKTVKCTAPTSKDYLFAGYYLNKADAAGVKDSNTKIFDASGNFLYDNFMASEPEADSEITLYAAWKPKTYQYAYVVNGNVVQTTDYVYGTTFSLQDVNAEKMGHSLVGWSLSEDAKEIDYKAGDTIHSQDWKGQQVTYLYPIYRANTYTIRYHAGTKFGGAEMPDEQKTYSDTEKFKLAKNLFYRTGYTFAGWTRTDPAINNSAKADYFDEQSVPSIGGFLSDNETVDLYALWKPISYNLVLKDGFSDAEIVYSLEYNKTFKLPQTAFSRKGYSFSGWKTETGELLEKDGSVHNLADTEDAVVNLTAVWNVYQYTIRVSSAEIETGSLETDDSGSQTGVYGKALTLRKCNIKKPGHRFIGWSLEKEQIYDSESDAASHIRYQDQETITLTPSKEDEVITLYPIWLREAHTISYYVGDDKVQEDTFYYGETPNLYSPEREGYVFGGWFLPSGNQLSTLANINSDLVLHSKWTRIKYLIQANCPADYFYINDQEVVHNGDRIIDRLDYTKSIDSVKVSTEKVGTLMSGFILSKTDGTVLLERHFDPTDNYEEVLKEKVTPVDGMVLTLQLSERVYSLEYDLSGGKAEGDLPQNYKSGQTIDLPSVTKDGYSFVGWKDDSGNVITSITDTYVGNKHLTAVFDRGYVPVAFELNEGVVKEDLPSEYLILSTPIDLPKEVAKTGSCFIGWYDEYLKRFVTTIDTSVPVWRKITAKFVDTASNHIEKIIVNPTDPTEVALASEILSDDEDVCYQQLTDIGKKVYTTVYRYYADAAETAPYLRTESVRIAIGTESRDNIEDAMTALVMEHPELFWISAFDLSLKDEETGTICITPRQAYSLIQIAADYNEYDANLANLINSCGEGSSLEKLTSLAGVLGAKQYQYFAGNTLTSRDLRSPAYNLVLKKGSSESLAKIVRILCQKWKIPCVMYYGESECWNLVQIDGEWYYLNLFDTIVNGAKLARQQWENIPSDENSLYNNEVLPFIMPEIKNNQPVQDIPTPSSTPEPAQTPGSNASPAGDSNRPGVQNVKTESVPQVKSFKTGGVTYFVKYAKKGILITKMSTKKTSIALPKTATLGGKKYNILGFDKNAFSSLKKVKTLKIRKDYTFAKNSLKGLNKKVNIYVSKKYFKKIKKRLNAKAGWKKSMKLKKG